MTAYLAILSARFRLLLQYRAAALAGLATQVFWGLIRMMIFIAFYENAAAQPMDLAQTVSYVWLGQAFLLLMMLGRDSEISQMIRTGSVVYELVKPLDLYGIWFSRMLAHRVAPTLLRSMPILVVATLAGWLHWSSWPAVLAFAASLAGAAVLSAALGVLLNISMFWTVSGTGLVRMTDAAAYLLGGTMMPLVLFPDAWQTVLNLLPFRGLGDAPFRIFAGNIPPAGLAGVLLHQLIWAAVLVLAGRLLLRRAIRRLNVQGG